MVLIESINWTYGDSLASVAAMDTENRLQDEDREPSTHECECPEPCNCDHDNE